jgi:hypothetical protein
MRKTVVPNEHNQEFDAEFDATLRQFVRGRGQAIAAPPCAGLDADTAAAYLEQSLTPSARARYDAHLADCAACRRSLTELSRLMPQPAVHGASPVAAPAPTAPLKGRWASFSSWFDFSNWRWGLVAGGGAAGLAALLAVVLLGPTQSSQRVESVAQNAPSAQGDTSAAPTPSAAAEVMRSRPEGAQPLGSSSANDARATKLEQQGQVTAPAAPNAAAGQAALPPAPASAVPARQGVAAKAANVSGTVSDATGAAVAGAEVKLIDPASQQARSTTTNAAGEFNFSNVPPARYLVEAQAPGFVRQQNVADAQDASEVVALQLQTGAATETVQITSESQLRQDRAEIAKLSEPDRTQQRRDSELLQLSPGTASPEEKATEARKKAAKDGPRDEPARGGRLSEKEQVADAARSGETSAKAVRAAPPRAPMIEKREAPGKPAAPPTRKVGEKTFRLENGVWVDVQYRPADNLPATRLTSGTEEFNRAVAERPALKPFFDLKPVVVVWQGRVYHVEGRK